MIQEIIAVAIERGWNDNGFRQTIDLLINNPYYFISRNLHYTFFFTHPFAKAMWGEEEYLDKLSELVQADNCIEYLYAEIGEKGTKEE